MTMLFVIILASLLVGVVIAIRVHQSRPAPVYAPRPPLTPEDVRAMVSGMVKRDVH